MYVKCEIFTVIWLTIFSLTNADGFDLKELNDIEMITNDPITTDLTKLEMIEYALLIAKRAYGEIRSLFNPLRFVIGEYITKPEEGSDFFLPRVSLTDEERIHRERPQYVISYHQALNSIVVYFDGTDIKNQNYDYVNLNNVVPTKVELTKYDNHMIEVYGGIYNAVNTELLYAGSNHKNIPSLLDDLQSIIDRVYAENDNTIPINKLYITGHSQGGAIATLFTILWQSRGNCNFVKYFENNGSPELKRLMDDAEVITYGAVSIFGNTINGADFIDIKYHDKILNIINPKDWIPMAFTGTVEPPETSLEENHDTLIDILEIFAHESLQAFGDNADNIEFYGPAGIYMVISQKDGQVMLRRLDKDPDPYDLFDHHLVHGSSMLKSLGFGQIKAFWLLWNNHMSGVYASPLADCVEYHKNKIVEPKYIFPKK